MWTGYPKARTAPHPSTELALAMGAPAPGFFDNTPAGEIAAMVPGAIAGGALTAAGVPVAVELAREAAVAYTVSSPFSLPETIRFVEGVVGGPSPTMHHEEAIGGLLIRPVVEEMWWRINE